MGGVLTGGHWFAEPRDGVVHAGLDVTRRWRPRGLPLLMRLVTTVVPVFRRWPTTYRWRGVLRPDDAGAPGWSGGWERVAGHRGADAASYRKATGT